MERTEKYRFLMSIDGAVDWKTNGNFTCISYQIAVYMLTLHFMYNSATPHPKLLVLNAFQNLEF